MIRQLEFEVLVAVNPIRLIFKIGNEGATYSLYDLNKERKKLIQIIELKDDRQEINRKIAIFEWEEN